MDQSLSLAICACARNITPYLSDSIVRINQFIRVLEARVTEPARFKCTIVIVYSQHNKDDTVAKLHEWSNTDDRVVLISDGINHPHHFSSINLTTARNKYMEHLRSLSEPPHLVVCLDIDDRLAEYTFDLVGLARCLDYSWDALSVLTTPYYDWFALRDPRINLRNQFEGVRLGFPQSFTLQTMHKFVDEWEHLPDDGEQPRFIPVLSAFSACTIYRWSAIEHCTYSYRSTYSMDDELPDCEHFAFHIQMANNGGKLVMSPSFRSCPVPVSHIQKAPSVEEPVLSYYSQYGQDQFIDSHFLSKRNGVFVDIGAHDGIHLSNSYFLEVNRGWTGLCVEANPDVYNMLVKNRPNPGVHKECTAVYHQDDQEVTFVQITGYSEVLSGLRDTYDPQHERRIAEELTTHGGQAKHITVQTSTLKRLLNKYEITHVDYLSIDTEGSEINILKGIDWNAVYIDVMGVEVNYLKQGQEIVDYMNSLNMYDVIWKYEADWFFKRRRAS